MRYLSERPPGRKRCRPTRLVEAVSDVHCDACYARPGWPCESPTGQFLRELHLPRDVAEEVRRLSRGRAA